MEPCIRSKVVNKVIMSSLYGHMGSEKPVCGRDLTVGCVPARCGRDLGHEGGCSILAEDEHRSLDGEARRMYERLFPVGLP